RVTEGAAWNCRLSSTDDDPALTIVGRVDTESATLGLWIGLATAGTCGERAPLTGYRARIRSTREAPRTGVPPIDIAISATDSRRPPLRHGRVDSWAGRPRPTCVSRVPRTWLVLASRIGIGGPRCERTRAG